MTYIHFILCNVQLPDAQSRCNPFIYRIYASAPGVGGAMPNNRGQKFMPTHYPGHLRFDSPFPARVHSLAPGSLCDQAPVGNLNSHSERP